MCKSVRLKAKKKYSVNCMIRMFPINLRNWRPWYCQTCRWMTYSRAVFVLLDCKSTGKHGKWYVIMDLRWGQPWEFVFSLCARVCVFVCVCLWVCEKDCYAYTYFSVPQHWRAVNNGTPSTVILISEYSWINRKCSSLNKWLVPVTGNVEGKPEIYGVRLRKCSDQHTATSLLRQW